MKIFLFAFYKVPLSQQEVLFPAKESLLTGQGGSYGIRKRISG